MYDILEAMEARSASQAKYDKDNTYNVHLKLNLKYDRDILYWLNRQRSKQGSIKRLIREEIQRNS